MEKHGYNTEYEKNGGEVGKVVQIMQEEAEDKIDEI